MATDRALQRIGTATKAPRIFGEPYETSDGSTVITVARPGGGPFPAAPLGVFVVHEGQVTWAAAADKNRAALLGIFTGLAAAVIATLAVLRRPPWPDLSAAGIKAWEGVERARSGRSR